MYARLSQNQLAPIFIEMKEHVIPVQQHDSLLFFGHHWGFIENVLYSQSCVTLSVLGYRWQLVFEKGLMVHTLNWHLTQPRPFLT